MVPSPHTTVMDETVPSGSVVLIVKETGVPVGVMSVDSVKLTSGGRSVIVKLVILLVVTRPSLSVAFT